MMISYKFQGTSHGGGYKGIISGLPNGFAVDVSRVASELFRRKCGYGRSMRQSLPDEVTFVGEENGQVVVNGDLEFFVPNKSHDNRPQITALRSGHIDVVGQARYGTNDIRSLYEVASARNTLCYVVVGAICKQLLESKNIFTYSYTESIGGVTSRNRYVFGESEKQEHFALVHCPCKWATSKIKEKIDKAREDGNSLGGVTVVGATGVPMGLGDVFPLESRLDAVICGNLMAIPSVKAVEMGLGKKYATLSGTECFDKLQLTDDKIVYQTNNCGGIVAGITTGKDIVAKLTVKPVPTVKGIKTIDNVTHQEANALYERADTCVVPNVGVIGENILAIVLVNQLSKQNLL